MNEEGISGMKAIVALLYSKGPSDSFCGETEGREKGMAMCQLPLASPPYA